MSDSSGQDKAAKLAAARKRFEELKKKKPPTKKAESSERPSTETTLGKEADSIASSEGTDYTDEKHSTAVVSESADGSRGLPDSQPTEISHTAPDTSSSDPEYPNIETPANETQKPGHLRRQSLVTTGELSPENLPEIYRKQVSTITDLRAERQRLLDEVYSLRDAATRSKEIMVARDKALEDLASTTEELQALKEKLGVDQAIVREGAGEVHRLNSEISSLRRQVSHLDSQVIQKDKTISEIRRGSTSEASSRLENAVKTKEEQLENMSVELSELQTALEKSTNSTKQLSLERDSLKAQVKSLREEIGAVKAATELLNQKLNLATHSVTEETTTKSLYEAKAQAQEASISELKSQLMKLELLVKQLKASQLIAQESKRDLEIRNGEINKKLVNYQRENGDLQARIAEMKSKHQKTQAEGHQARQSHPDTKEKSRGLGFDDEGDSLVVEGNVHRGKMNSPPGLQSQPDELSGLFSDIDLRVTSARVDADSITNGINSLGGLFYNKATSENIDESRYFTDEIKTELMRWSGYKLDIRDIWSMHDSTESKVFEA